MRIRTRLFLLIALLVLGIVGLQWWLGLRQIETTREELVTVASTVGHSLVAELHPASGGSSGAGGGVSKTSSGFAADTHTHAAPTCTVPDNSTVGGVLVITSTLASGQSAAATSSHLDVHAAGSPATEAATGCVLPSGETLLRQHLQLKVVQGHVSDERYLVVSRPDGQTAIPIPVAAPTHRARMDLRRGLLLSGGLLATGLLAAALIAHRVTVPLRQLAAGVEAVGGGGFQTRVPVSGGGEIGELQRSFNAMAERLAALEAERDTWRAREHLAELGDLARGLAHTLRNPLNTLGLAVEELAVRGDADRVSLVSTARAQIRRVDRWLLSFLALGAGQGAEPEPVDLNDLAGEVTLEAVQGGAGVTLEAWPQPVVARVVAGALRAALANLVENAVQASPAPGSVTVVVARDRDLAVLRVADRGPGLPPEVRRRLFEPHVTTKVGGAGMGLFLARQLVEAGLGGRLQIRDREGGGTEAAIVIPAEPADPSLVS